MPHTLQSMLATRSAKAADDLMAAFLALPEDKRDWKPTGDARSALNIMAECAILNGNAASTLVNRVFTMDGPMDEFHARRDKLAEDWQRCEALFTENTARLLKAIRETAADAIASSIETPWGPMELAEIASYPYWNMTYHLGQINYIASMLGCLA